MQPSTSQGATATADPMIVAANAVKGISHIATLPEITVSIIRLVEDPTSTAEDLNKVISNDPALCSRILKVVNSAFYGLPRQIGSMNRAISLLGLNAVKNLAIAASLAKLFRGGVLCSRFDAKELWAHSIGVAVASKMIAQHLRLNFADEAFLAGLIHDIGVVVELQVDRERLTKVVNELEMGKDGEPTGDFMAHERRHFQCDHGLFGQALCESWKFPKSFAYVCGHHHDPTGVPHEHRMLPWIVHIADRLAASACKGFRLDLSSLEVSDQALAATGLTREGLEAIRAGLPGSLRSLEAEFAVS